MSLVAALFIRSRCILTSGQELRNEHQGIPTVMQLEV